MRGFNSRSGLMIEIVTSTLSKIPVGGLLVLAATSVIFGDFSAKNWSSGAGDIWYVFAFIGYFGSAFFFIPTLLRESLVMTSVIWVVISSIGFLFIGIVLFHESLTLVQFIGVFLGIAGVLLLSL